MSHQESDNGRGVERQEKDEDLVGLLDGDSFVSEEERRAKRAEQRRLERKRRIESLQHEPRKVKAEAQHSVSAPMKEEPVPVKVENITETQEDEEDDDDDGFDMFSSSVSPPTRTTTTMTKTTTTTTATTGTEQQDWDDAEGYYKAVIGEVISLMNHQIRFRVAGVVGKGVFSTVLKCTTVDNTTSWTLPPQVAMKCIRHNESMAKSALLEVELLQRCRGSTGIIPLLLPKEEKHKGHVLILFPYMEYNLRDVLVKFGKGVGLSLQAVQSYFGQLLAAAMQLKKHGILHADIKPDNILVRQDFATVQIADFGSAIDLQTVGGDSGLLLPTPYLVSRFYRAPEIILGLACSCTTNSGTTTASNNKSTLHAMDLWSIAVTVAELYLGQVLLPGRTNNDMLFQCLQQLGPFSNRLIRQHLVQWNKYPNFLTRHFIKQATGDYVFAQASNDPVTGKAIWKEIPNTNTNPSLQQTLRRAAKKFHDPFYPVSLLADLLQKCCTLDPSRRIALKDALSHDFFLPLPPKPTE